MLYPRSYSVDISKSSWLRARSSPSLAQLARKQVWFLYICERERVRVARA